MNSYLVKGHHKLAVLGFYGYLDIILSSICSELRKCLGTERLISEACLMIPSSRLP